MPIAGKKTHLQYAPAGLNNHMMQKFIIPHIQTTPSTAIIQGQDARHIARVLRLSVGDPIEVTDGRGRDYTAQIAAVSPDNIQVKILEGFNSCTESTLGITLCSGMLKDKKMDMVIKHVTQLGIHQWIPFFCQRSIPTPDAKRIDKRHQRWETIARESLKQCRRSRVPRIQKPLSLETLLDQFQDHDLKIAFWENAVLTLGTLEKSSSHRSVMILIGPEGGFSKSEIALAEEKGFLSYSLGPRILRAETAAISSCTLVQHLLGDI